MQGGGAARFRWRTLALLDDLSEQHDADDGQRLFRVFLDVLLDLGARQLGYAPGRLEKLELNRFSNDSTLSGILLRPRTFG